MKALDPNGSPRPRLISLPQHDDPLLRFSDDEDCSAPTREMARRRLGVREGLGEPAGYISVSGRRTPELDDTVPDWSMGPSDPRLVDYGYEPPLRVAHRYEPRPERTVHFVAIVAVCGLLTYALYLDRPDFTRLSWWRAGANVIELPPILPPPAPSRLADEPGRVAAAAEPVRTDPAVAPIPQSQPASEPAPNRSITLSASKGLDLVVDDSAVSIQPARPLHSESAAGTARPKATATSNIAPPSTTGGDEATIRHVISEFQVAYNALDVQRTKRVWPSVDAAALTHVFQSLKAQHLELVNCQVATKRIAATATCSGHARVVPRDKDKSTRVESRLWVFNLAKTIDRWDVVTLNMR